MSKVFFGDPPSNIKQWIINKRKQNDKTVYKVQTTSSYKKTGIYRAQRDDANKPVTIDWGDGNVEEVAGDINQKTHTYSSVGEFTVEVYNIKTFAASANSWNWYQITSQNQYTLKEVVQLNKSITSIQQNAFRGCSGLTSMTIGNTVTSIEGYAFADCIGITSMTIGNSVTSIGEYAFVNCTRLKSIMIPDSVTSIEEYAFSGCNGLTSVHITDLAKWCGISFKLYDSNPLYYAHNLYLNGELLTELTIPDSVTSIGGSAFSGCSGLSSVTIPDGVKSIGSTAFYSCSGLTSLTIPDSVTSIGNLAFEDCISLTTMTINSSYLANSTGAFCFIPNLAEIQAQNMTTDYVAANAYDWQIGFYWYNGGIRKRVVVVYCFDGVVVVNDKSGSSS